MKYSVVAAAAFMISRKKGRGPAPAALREKLLERKCANSRPRSLGEVTSFRAEFDYDD